MAKILYHLGTSTYFDLSDDVYVIDTDEVTEQIDAEMMDEEGDSIATYWGRRIVDVVTETNNGKESHGFD